MGTNRYTGLSVVDGRRMVYINGDTNTASNSINIPKLNTLGLGYTIGADTSAPRTIVLGNVNNLAADSRAIVSAVKHLTIWEEAGDIKESDIDPATSTVLEVASAIDANTGGRSVSSMKHKGGAEPPAHNVSALKFTIELAWADDMHTKSAIVDSFDVFLHTVNDGFLRLAKDLDDVEYDTTLPAANALTWSLWDRSERYNRAKGATANKSLAKLEFEAGSGANYVQRLTSEALYAAERKEIATLTASESWE